MMATRLRGDAKVVTGSWGWFLLAGIAWILFAFIVLTFNYTTVWAIAVFFGIGFIIGGVMEIIAGFIALIWPGETFLVLSAIVGWLLLFYGIIDVVFAFSTRHLDTLWWLQLLTGIIMVLIGFWAIAPDDATVSTYRGSVLLVVWVGFAALFRGISDLIIGFRLHSAHKALDTPNPA
jgi:uncharacterized membrane protein HdeD (DUF308 family)